MNAMLASLAEFEPEYEISFRETDAPGVPYEVSTRSKYMTRQRYARKKTGGGALSGGAHRRGSRRSAPA